MTEEKKEGCGNHKASCCGTKKLLVGILIGGLIFAAGMLFAKTQCGSGFCPLPQQSK